MNLNFFDIVALIETVGYVGLWSIVFAESGLLVGFFLPGDSLLFTAGFLASQGFFNIWSVIILCLTAAVFGDSVGYAFGHKVGHRLFSRKDSLIFNLDNLVKAQEFYEKYGGKTIILARFIPVVRTFAPILAGIASMKYRKFLTYNLVGGILWGAGIPIIGFWLGSVIPQADRYILGIVGAIIFLSALPQIIIILKSKKNRRRIVSFLKGRYEHEPPVNP